MSHNNVAIYFRSANDMDERRESHNQAVDAGSLCAGFEADAEPGMNAKTDRYGCWPNPSARYDYYSLGGRGAIPGKFLPTASLKNPQL